MSAPDLPSFPLLLQIGLFGKFTVGKGGLGTWGLCI